MEETKTPQISDEALIRYVLACRDEADSARKDRIRNTRDNYDQYHLKHNFEHKRPGQSTEVLSKLKMAVEQTKSFFVQSLIDVGDWWKVEPTDGSDGSALLIKPSEIYKLTDFKTKQAGLYSHVGQGIQAALLGSLWLSKVDGCMKPKPKFVARKKGRGKDFKRWLEKAEGETWHLKYNLIDHENYYPDPTGAGLYEVEECFLDLHAVHDLAEEPYNIYDMSAVKELEAYSTVEHDQQRADKTGQNTRLGGFRKQVKITELWGDIIDEESGEMIAENCVCTIANERVVIRKPTPNPLWHQRSPIIAAALLEVGNSVWHTALMDAGTKHNRVQTEVFNLMLDAALQAIHNIGQVRIDDLDDPKQISNGIPPGTKLKVRSSLPHGAKVMEEVTTGKIPPEVLNMYSIVEQAGNSAMLTNEVRSGGAVGGSSVRATAVVEASNTINTVFQGITKSVEQSGLEKILELSWQTVAQNWDLIDKEEFVALFGRERGEELSQMPPEEVFANTVGGIKFTVFGISQILAQQADFRKYTTLLQTLGASDVLIEAFLQKYGEGFGKLIEEIIRSLGIDTSKLSSNPAKPAPQAPPPAQALAQPGAAPGASPQAMSQVPSAGAGSLASILSGGMATQQPFPGSRALANRGGGA